MQKRIKREVNVGDKFGPREVVSYAGLNKFRRKLWNVKCDCSKEFSCTEQDLHRQLIHPGCRSCAQSKPKPSRRKRPYEYRYNCLVNRGRHPVNISYEQFLEFTKIRECHYCGVDVDWGEPFGKGRSTACNLDRKDNTLPYELDNVVVSCRRCNYGKNDFFSYSEWLELGSVIRSWRDSR